MSMNKILIVGLLFSIAFFSSCSSSKTGSATVNSADRIFTLEDHILKSPGAIYQYGKIRVRVGSASFSSNGEPLYEINGQVINGGFTAAKAMVNPVDIESIQVLRNPDELALYGVRGRNGVIRIRLKNSQG